MSNNEEYLAPFHRIRWETFKNTGSTTIPPFGAIEIENADKQDTDTVTYLKCKRPTQDFLPRFAINGPTQVAAGDWGNCTTDGSCYGLTETSTNAPAVGDIVGTKKDSFTLTSSDIGVVVFGDIDSTNGRAKVRFDYAKEFVPFTNSSGETCPLGAVMSITSIGAIAGSKGGRYVIGKPTTTLERYLLVNFTPDVADGGKGLAKWLLTADYVAYDTGSGTPLIGESWGPKQGQWTLAKYRYGFTIVGQTTTLGGSSLVRAYQRPVDRVRGKTTASWIKGATATIRMYDGSGIDSSIDVPSVNNIFTDIESDKAVFIEWLGGSWHVYAAEC